MSGDQSKLFGSRTSGGPAARRAASCAIPLIRSLPAVGSASRGSEIGKKHFVNTLGGRGGWTMPGQRGWDLVFPTEEVLLGRQMLQ